MHRDQTQAEGDGERASEAALFCTQLEQMRTALVYSSSGSTIFSALQAPHTHTPQRRQWWRSPMSNFAVHSEHARPSFSQRGRQAVRIALAQRTMSEWSYACSRHVVALPSFSSVPLTQHFIVVVEARPLLPGGSTSKRERKLSSSVPRGCAPGRPQWPASKYVRERSCAALRSAC